MALIASLSIPLLLPHTQANLRLYCVLGVISCLLITKDEWIHAKACEWKELWLHSVLFIVHPALLILVAVSWGQDSSSIALHFMLEFQIVAMLIFSAYQVVYWSFWAPAPDPVPTLDPVPRRKDVNNEIYESLGDRWYTAEDDPVALLRAESRLKNPWVLEVLKKELGDRSCRVLDIGCGAGFLVRDLERAGHAVTGIDLSPNTLMTAQRHNPGLSAELLCMSADELHRFQPGTFDAVCAMDFLEHVAHPAAVIAEAAKILKPGGLFFYHTFNRNPLSWLLVIKSLEWFVKNTPERLHLYSMFIKPSELTAWCRSSGLETQEIRGIRPRVDRALWKMLRTGHVDSDFEFVFSSSTLSSYAGYARLT